MIVVSFLENISFTNHMVNKCKIEAERPTYTAVIKNMVLLYTISEHRLNPKTLKCFIEG